MSYVVIENTPGYLPENDDPATFEMFEDAYAYAVELAHELEDEGYEISEDLSVGQIYAERSPTDLGRVIEIVTAE